MFDNGPDFILADLYTLLFLGKPEQSTAVYETVQKIRKES